LLMKGENQRFWKRQVAGNWGQGSIPCMSSLFVVNALTKM